jgi:hypothetical protein
VRQRIVSNITCQAPTHRVISALGLAEERRCNALHSSAVLQTCIRHLFVGVSPIAGVGWGACRLMAPSTVVSCAPNSWEADS